MQRPVQIFLRGMLVLVLGVAGCGQKTLTVREAWVRPAAAGENSAVYFTIANSLDEADALLSAESDAADAVELHSSMDMGGVMSMQHQERVEVPAEGTVVFEPGGYHVMLLGLTDGLEVGENIELTLHFERQGAVTVSAEVKEQ